MSEELKNEVINENENSTLEEDFKKLDALLSDMEKDDIGIEEAFAKYTEGMKLVTLTNSDVEALTPSVMLLGGGALGR